MSGIDNTANWSVLSRCDWLVCNPVPISRMVGTKGELSSSSIARLALRSSSSRIISSCRLALSSSLRFRSSSSSMRLRSIEAFKNTDQCKVEDANLLPLFDVSVLLVPVPVFVP